MKKIVNFISGGAALLFSGMVSADRFSAVSELNDMAEDTVQSFLSFLGGAWVTGVVTLVLIVIGIMAVTNKDQSNERKASLWAVFAGCVLILSAPMIAKVFGAMRAGMAG